MPPPSPPAPSAVRPQLRGLDGLRGLAIGGVLACHFLNAWPGGTAWDRAFVDTLGLGWSGVDLFFVLSGFLITGILVDSLGAENWWSAFLARRALRIFPLHYLALAAFALLGPAAGLVDPWTIRRWGWWYAAYLGNWAFPARQVIPSLSHFWSLGVEEQFYLAWPAVVRLARGWRLAVVSALLFAAGPAVRWWIVHRTGWPAGSAYRVTPGRMDELALGALLAVLHRAPAARAAIARAWPWAAAAGLAAFAALGLPRGFDMHDAALETWSHTFLGLGYAGLVAGAVATEGTARPFARALASRPLRALGRYSYGIYVVHYFVHEAALRALRARPWGAAALSTRGGYAAYAALGAGASIALAAASFHLVEARFLALKRWFEPRRGAAEVTPRRSARTTS